MKRCLLVLIVLVFTLNFWTGCSSKMEKPTEICKEYHNSYYSIINENGRYYLIPKTEVGVQGNTTSVDVYRVLLFPQFASVADMRQGIITGSYMEEDELLAEAYLFSFDYQADNEVSTINDIEICNIDNLYECILPTDLTTRYIEWHGKDYVYKVYGETATGWIYCCDVDQYTAELSSEYKEFLYNPDVTVTEQWDTEERNASVYYVTTVHGNKLKYICYEIQEGDKRVFIQETYALELDHDLTEPSADVPTMVYFWGTDNSGYFTGWLSDMSERPSLEWLSQFGLREYVETVVA